MAKLTFIGTRGEIEARTQAHGMHTSLLIETSAGKLMVDCGLDWLGKFERLEPDAILLTHAHPDHAWGLRDGAPCPVYATDRTWSTLQGCKVENPLTVPLRTRTEILGLEVEAYPVEHSIRCPAVGYRIKVDGKIFFYSPDVAYIPERGAALGGANLYIGDGASITRPMIRRRGEAIFGHAAIRTQLTWCEKEGVPEAVFTHCGSEIVEGEEESVARQVAALGAERGVRARVAKDREEMLNAEG